MLNLIRNHDIFRYEIRCKDDLHSHLIYDLLHILFKICTYHTMIYLIVYVTIYMAFYIIISRVIYKKITNDTFINALIDNLFSRSI